MKDMQMEKLIEGIVVTSVAAVVVIFAVMAGALGGALSGYVVSFFFDETIHSVMSAIHQPLAALPLWKVGCFFGFIGGFFRSVVSQKK